MFEVFDDLEITTQSTVFFTCTSLMYSLSLDLHNNDALLYNVMFINCVESYKSWNFIKFIVEVIVLHFKKKKEEKRRQCDGGHAHESRCSV